MTGHKPVTTWYLEMTSPEDLRPAESPNPNLEMLRLDPPNPQINRQMYADIGGEFEWTDRRDWNDVAWHRYVHRPEIETWIGLLRGQPVGFAELERQGTDVELVSFGLLAPFRGRRLGGAMLTAVIRRAWELGAERVWVHTCSLDSPAALPSYQRRGFRHYDTRLHMRPT
jgi:GNAT superfamily N-acetyltransferase